MGSLYVCKGVLLKFFYVFKSHVEKVSLSFEGDEWDIEVLRCNRRLVLYMGS